MTNRRSLSHLAAAVLLGLAVCSVASAGTGSVSTGPAEAARIAQAIVSAAPARIASAVPALPRSLPAVQVLQVQDQPPPATDPPSKPDVQVTKTETTTIWYANPIWIGVILLGAVVLILLVAIAMRSGSSEHTERTTVVHH